MQHCWEPTFPRLLIQRFFNLRSHCWKRKSLNIVLTDFKGAIEDNVAQKFQEIAQSIEKLDFFLQREAKTI
ncbi:MAG: hypothetical protein ACFFCQ_03715 [Promethearchaeota archaeon]